MLVRDILGIANAIALLSFRQAIVQAYGNVAGYWYILLQASQFHVMYYASRSLPNMFAFTLSTLAFQSLILSSFGKRGRRVKRMRLALYLLTVAGVIFRSELAIMVATTTLSLVFTKGVSLRRVILPTGIFAALVALLVTVAVDSFFWQRFPLWPEWIAFRFNTLEGRASEWGTSPWHYYFTNSIPRLMLNPVSLLICLPTALLVKSTRSFSIDILGPLFAYIAVYSVLPHKEWRFIIYTVPGLTGVASAGASWIWSRKYKSSLHIALCLLLVGSTVASFGASTGLLYISSLNYPGAVALQRLHDLAHGSQPHIRVHLDNLSCQTGVTRFLQMSSLSREAMPMSIWSYDKSEDITKLADDAFWQQFDYVLTEHGTNMTGQWEHLETIDGFDGISMVKESVKASILERYVNYSARLPLVVYQPRVRMRPKIDILRRVTLP
ncbi:MAG: dolichyl-P-Man:Man(7)GlcNAc(2)-PP-dolichol alpha-1,6-mannosyltransferase [Chrysothrix sp. TS-e1954]|nr:MAG: dolichyl-P-Man:Man(7)GlcNAc(2)-PP-dolichol alpha-1,6-mannosyltransferase [Chrysothrix sp. TS-e1954]